MSKVGVLFRTTAVRLSALYLVLFSLCAVFLVFYVTGMSERLLQQQTREGIAVEAAQIEDIYERAGVNGLLRSLERRARQPGANLYVIAGPSGEILAGNVAGLEPGLLDDEGWTSEPFHYRRFTDENRTGNHVALAQVLLLDNGLRILVGRDLQEPEKFRVLVRQALVVALGIMGLGALVIWFGIGRNALRRIDRMSEASTKIMAGDLSQRLPTSGSGDEFDRLSESLNAMLGRIEKLNEGLKQVSDNIAHDLKTPLTRLRNKAEAALASKEGGNQNGALEEIIGESDQLIRTFNALLMISRVEAGSAVAEMSDVDLSGILADCVELYEPVAEEGALRLEADVQPGIVVAGNRELIGQALGNLIDNAIKYAEGAENPLIRVEMKKSGANVVLKVADHGPGVPENMRDEVVKRFVRLDESRTKPGTGLGLSLVEAVMEMHHGSLDLSATEPDGKGLTVRLVFPAGVT
ncbi:sensor histidine kinase [Sinorhizobium americanum]|uniref:histidine kinase n=1 Tax=Sinorhizobium americanum TaxID=194963 RepID=A0A1L3LK41_9HYPH|nr:HAMP domain-containing sensor histidine kinase [Sinorhizobium americanum]APG83863.1 sensor histidine kinase [Sinorhizobium americanum CCGM7]APG90413.1 sensor histidine kinase [Sinorhizobium americanum]OAP37998.1 histidine kinase [Sinorhizobium americanum]TCN30809.1 signal transduction histidine kinase [Sinorhizobium americanum]